MFLNIELQRLQDITSMDISINVSGMSFQHILQFNVSEMLIQYYHSTICDD